MPKNNGSVVRDRVSVIIRAFNEAHHIGNLLDNIFKQELGNRLLEVIVVDSGSTDGTIEIVKGYPVKLVHIKPKEFSFGRSLNTGIKASQGSILVFVSAHCYPDNKKWLINLVTPFDGDRMVGLVYGKQRGDWRTKFSENQIFLKLFPDESNSNQFHPFCNNANCAIRRSLWEETPYDEDLTGLEDLDWAKKIVQMGYHLSYRADAEIIHVHEENWSKVFRRYEREAIALKRIFPEMRFTFFDFLKLFFINALIDYARGLGGGIRLKDIGWIFVFRLMQFWGTYRGTNYGSGVTDRLRRQFYYPKFGK